MTDFPADWAIERALEPVNSQWEKDGIPATSVDGVKSRNRFGNGLAASILAHARLIEKHEKPPVDPDLLLAREIAALVADELDRSSTADFYRDGIYDDDDEMVKIVQLLKERGK